MNGATCTDHFRAFECTCPPGWRGDVCDIDINECEEEMPCQNNASCENYDGSYACLCGNLFCGQTCTLNNPCLEFTCQNDGICRPDCDETIPFNNTRPFCDCTEGWGGELCEEDISGLTNTALAIIVGSLLALICLGVIVGLVVFFMMAKKKRATRGTYSPSRQEFYSPRVEMGDMMKTPPEERLI